MTSNGLNLMLNLCILGSESIFKWVHAGPESNVLWAVEHHEGSTAAQR